MPACSIVFSNLYIVFNTLDQQSSAVMFSKNHEVCHWTDPLCFCLAYIVVGVQILTEMFLEDELLCFHGNNLRPFKVRKIWM